MAKAHGIGYARTGREAYSCLIGYEFGEYIYNGAYWEEKTGKKQYEFFKYADGKNSPPTGKYLTDYKGFREIIDKYNWPRK